MRRLQTALGLVVLVAVMAGPLAGSASAGGNKKLVEGTVYDTTCLETSACGPPCPPPPHCGPVTMTGARIICPQQRIVACPLSTAAAETSPPVCLPASGCFTYPVYAGEGAIVNVRKRGSATVPMTLPVVEGHFEARLGPGEYVLHPRLPEEPCWSGSASTVTVRAKWKGPLSASVDVHDTCVAHPGTTN
jgi:hypothetical protein